VLVLICRSLWNYGSNYFRTSLFCRKNTNFYRYFCYDTIFVLVFIFCLPHDFGFVQEYVPKHCDAEPKLRWEMEMVQL